MNISDQDFKQHFALLSDAALLETKPEDFVQEAQDCLRDELARRGLMTETEDESEGVAATGPSVESHELSAGEELVLIATYTVADDASLARGLLESASIPARLENENLGLGAFQLRLLVPAAFEQDALEVLEYEISDEDLAAQAEEAGGFTDDESGESVDEDSGNEEEAGN